MKKIFVFGLIASLLANAWLWQRRSDSIRILQIPTAPAARPPAAPERGRPESASLVVAVRAGLTGTDLTALRDSLVAAGASDSTVRGVLRGVLQRRFAAEKSARQVARLRNAWWRGPNPAAEKDDPSYDTWVGAPLRKLVGVNPLDLADAELRYDFLPPEKRRRLAEIDVDYLDLLARPTRTSSGTKSDSDEYTLLLNERRKDLTSLLSPEELKEYELRFDMNTLSSLSRYAAMEATEEEFRTIQPLLKAFNDQQKSARLADPGARAARLEMEQRTLDQIVAAVGYERALDFSWAASSVPYQPVAQAMRELALPPSRAAQWLELGAETGLKAEQIHRDETLSVDQKRAALAALQAAVRPQADALVPPALQARLTPEVAGWFTGLGEGRYVQLRPSGVFSGAYSPSTVSVETPLRYPSQPMALPRRGG